jgi:hypothetical protein
VDIGSPLVAYREPTVADQPRQHDSVRSTTHLCRPNRSLVSFPLLEIRLLLNAAPAQNCSAARKVVAFVGVQLLGSAVWPAPSGVLDRLDSIHQLLEYLRVMDIGGGEHYGERNAVTVGHEVMFGARLPSVGRVGPNRFAPFLRVRSSSPSLLSTSPSCQSFLAGPAVLGADDTRRLPCANP